MSVHLGLMIWKEMKLKGMSVSTFAEKMSIGKAKAQAIINSATLDVSMLANVSEVIGYNFFTYFENGETLSTLNQKELQRSNDEISRLKAIIKEKCTIIELKDKTIKNLTETINLLEKEQYL